MIEIKEVLEEFSGSASGTTCASGATCAAVWASAGDDMELATVVQDALDAGVRLISCVPESVGTLWPWLEKTGVRIVPRFYCAAGVKDEDVSDLVMRINASFKSGADGAQVFVRAVDVDKFVAQIGVVRDDLFFNKDLIIGVDINEINPFDWPALFDALRRVRANGLMLVLPKFAGDASDFSGRVYAAMQAWNFDGELQFYCGGGAIPIDQAARLISAMQPDIVPRTRFFVQG